MLNYINDKHTRDLADDLIGAAQQLERLARTLKDQAKTIRAHGIVEGIGFDAIDNMRGHKAYDVKRAAESALRELKALPDDARLVTTDNCV
jgi:hypothetical protein